MKLPFINREVGFSKGGITWRKTSPATNNRKTRASSDHGYEITQADRTRRMFNLVAGLTAQADRHLDKRTLDQLREICRMHDRRGPLFSGILDTAQDNIVGSNFEFNPETGDKDLDKKVKDYIVVRMQKENCDATGVRDFEDLMKTTLRAAWCDGDNLWTKRSDGSVLVFEADQVVTPAGRKKGIVLGVEMNDINKHTAYHVKQRTKAGPGGHSRVTQKSKRIPASKAIMPAFRKRINQTRGVPFLATALSFYTRFNSYVDWESLAAEGNAMLGYQITKKPDDNTRPGVVANTNTTNNDTFEQLEEMEPFKVFELNLNEEIKMIGANRPGSNFEPYIVICARIIGVSVGYPLELVMKDFSRTNFSSARASMGEARRSFRGWQKWLQKNASSPWYKWQIARGIMSGELPADPRVFKVRHQWPGWEYIDPKKSAEGNAIAISTATKSVSQCIRDQGLEPDKVFQEIADDNTKLKDLGITLPKATLKVIAGGNGPDQDKEDNNQNQEQENE